MKTNKILIPISTGELLDKISILKIKLEKIKDEEKIKLVKHEFVELEIELKKLNLDESIILKELFAKLMEVNKTLWTIEDKIRVKENQKSFDEEFIDLARAVYYYNDKRSIIKNEISILTNSFIFEVKGYEQY